MKKKKEKEKPLNPQMEKRGSEKEYSVEKGLEIARQLENLKKSLGKDKQDLQSFLVEILNALNSAESIQLKTEYVNEMENFCGVKIDFFSKYGNMSYLSDFLSSFEERRVSLKRRGRIENVMVLQQRQQEIQLQQQQETKKTMFGY